MEMVSVIFSYLNYPLNFKESEFNEESFLIHFPKINKL